MWETGWWETLILMILSDVDMFKQLYASFKLSSITIKAAEEMSLAAIH